MSSAEFDVRTVILVALAVILLVPLLTIGMGGAMGGPMTYGMHGGMWGDGGTGTATASGWLILASVLWRLLILVAVVVLGYLLYRGLTRSGDDDGADAVAELRLAYARGDLSDEEYERRRERLEGEG